MFSFERYHPTINFIYFVNLMIISTVMQNLMCQVICFTLLYIILFIYKIDAKVFKKLSIDLLFVIITTAVNMMFNHKGMTIIYYFKSGNPLTLESVIYGLYAGLMFVTILKICKFFNIILNSDKIIFLFSKISKNFALIISMTINYFYQFKSQFIEVRESRHVLDSSRGILSKVKSALNVTSIMISWSFENAIITANSMKSRGFGTVKKTQYNKFIFEKKDVILGIIMFIMIFSMWVFYCEFKMKTQFFPFFEFGKVDIFTVVFYIITLCFISLPIFLKIGENYKWKF